MAQSGNTGLRRIFNAFINSGRGMKACFGSEEAFRQEILLCLVLFPLSFLVADTLPEWLLLNGSLCIVLIVELLNTGIERAIDRISFDHHALSREAKDMGSAAVLISFVLLGLCWGGLLIF